MKLNIQSACQGGAIASVAGNIVDNKVAQFEFDFGAGEFFYLCTAEGKGRVKGQSSAEFALEHLRDGFSMGDITAENQVDDMFAQCRYLNLEINGVGKHLEDIAGHGCELNGVFGVEANGYSLAAGGGRAYVYRDGTLSPMSDPTAPLGYGVEEDEAAIWQMGSELADGDIVLVVSKAVTEALSDDELEDILYLSNYPAEHILCSAKDEGLEKDAPAAVVAAKVGGGDFREIDPDADYEDDDGKYDAWA